MSNNSQYDVFISYYEGPASDYASAINAVLTERGYNVFVAHLRRPYLSGSFRDIVDSAIKDCKIFLLINSIDAIERSEIIREVTIAFPNGKLGRKKFWIFKEKNEDVIRNSSTFTAKTGIDLSGLMQNDFETTPDLLRTVIRKCKNERTSDDLGIPNIQSAPIVSSHIPLGRTANTQVNIDEFMQHFQQSIQNREYEKALEILDTLQNIDPLNISIFNNKANILDSLGKFEEALENYSLALSINNKIPFLWANKASTLEKLGKFNEALESINKALSFIPKQIDFNLTKGHILFNKGEFDKELEIYEKILSADKNNSKAMSAKAAVLAVIGKKPEAFSLLNLAITKDSRNDNAWHNLSALLFEENKHEEALEKLKKARELNPYDDYSLNLMSRILRALGRYDEVITLCDKSIKDYSNKTIPYFCKGLTLMALDKFDDAKLCFDESIKINKRFVNALLNKAICLIRSGRKDECFATINEVLDLNISNPISLNVVGEILLELEKFDKAEEILRIARLKKSDNMQINSNLITVLDKQNKLNEALDICHQLLDTDPNNISVLINKSLFLIKLGRYDEALTDCDKVLELDKTVGAAYYNKACVASLQKRVSDAITLLEISMNYDPRSKETAKTDKDFDNIRDTSEFQKLIVN